VTLDGTSDRHGNFTRRHEHMRATTLQADAGRTISEWLEAHYQVIVGGLLVVGLALNIASIQHNSDTYDEQFHWRYGVRFFQGDLARKAPIDDSKMPFSAINALPSVIGQALAPDDRPAAWLDSLGTARLMTMFVSLALGLLVFRWSQELYGTRAGLFSLFIYTFEPNIIAHSRLVTTDLYAACMVTASLYFFWRFMKQPSWNALVTSALVFGLAQLAKYTAVFLVPVFVVLLLSSAVGRKWTKRATVESAKYATAFVLIALLVVNAGFLFSGTFKTLGAYQFRSQMFQTLQHALGWLHSFPIPLPDPYIDGLDYVRYREHEARGFGNMYLLGELHPDRGFPGYFLIASLFKVPIAILIFASAALLHVMMTARARQFYTRELFLIWPLLFFTVYFNWLNNSHIGIRFFLIVFPLVHVLCGCLLASHAPVSRARSIWGAGLCIYLVGSVASFYPHYISYVNELIPDTKYAYRVLADSNLDWNQDRRYLSEFMASNPNAIFEPKLPTSGKIVVGVNALTGVWIYNTPKTRMPERYRWLRQNFEPTGEIAHSYLIYDVTAEELAQVRESYVRNGGL
jgi:4-amino-4-deoxy-L-arabinose transferase-like glycosyltransferase